jgi:hypothetical protein
MNMKRWSLYLLICLILVGAWCLFNQLESTDTELSVFGFKIELQQEKVSGQVIDEDGKPLVAEIRFFDSEGGLVKRIQTNLKGEFGIHLDEGYYTIELSRGYEYERKSIPVEVRQGQPVQVKPTILTRLIDWRAKDYYGGDFNQHSHFSSEGQNTVEEVLTANLANGLSYGALADENTVDGNDEWNALADQVHYLALSGQTVMHRQQRYVAVNVPKQLTLDSEASIDSINQLGHQIHESNGILLTDALNDSIKSLLEGKGIDAIEIWNGQQVPPIRSLEGLEKKMTANVLRREKWFELLNQGMKITAVANSNNYDINGALIGEGITKNEHYNRWLADGGSVGEPRNYIKADELTVAGILKGIKEGHVFMTNGPLMDITINDKTFGDEISGVTDSEIAYLVTSNQSELMQLNIIADGEIIQEVPLAKNVPNLGTLNLNLSDYQWVAFEVLTTSYEYALSNPIYLKAD